MEKRNYIKATYTYSVAAQKKLLKKPLMISVILFAAGLSGLLAYIIWGTVWDTLYGYTPSACNALLICAVPFVIGLTVMLSVRTSIKSVRGKEGTQKRYEFYNDLLAVYETHGGDVGSVKIPYGQIARIKRRQNYIYLYCFNLTVLHMVDVTGLSDCELNTVYKLLNQPVSDGAEFCELQNFVNITE